MIFSFFAKVPHRCAHSTPEARPPKSDLAIIFLPRIRTTSHPHPTTSPRHARPTPTVDGKGSRAVEQPQRCQARQIETCGMTAGLADGIRSRRGPYRFRGISRHCLTSLGGTPKILRRRWEVLKYDVDHSPTDSLDKHFLSSIVSANRFCQSGSAHTRPRPTRFHPLRPTAKEHQKWPSKNSNAPISRTSTWKGHRNSLPT
jgi:hypothetical protein